MNVDQRHYNQPKTADSELKSKDFIIEKEAFPEHANVFKDQKFVNEFNKKFNPKKNLNYSKFDPKKSDDENDHFSALNGENNRSKEFRKDKFHWDNPWEIHKDSIRSMKILRNYKPLERQNINNYLQRQKQEKIVPEYFKKQISITK